MTNLKNTSQKLGESAEALSPLQKRQRREQTPEGQEKKRKYWKQYEEKNREVLKAKRAARNASKRKPPEFFIERKIKANENEKRRQQKYREKNKDAIKARIRKWKNENKNALLERNREKYKNDPIYRLTINHRNRISSLVKIKKEKSIDLLGCSIEEFKKHLESKFEKWMSWENYGSCWHIDHIMPCASFDLTKETHRRACFHYTNMQPLKAIENLRKNSKITNNHQFQLL
jgi:hypothetical protein